MSGCANYFSLFLKTHFPLSFKCDGKNLKTTDGQGDINSLFFSQLNKIHIWLHLTNSIWQQVWRQLMWDKNATSQGWAGVIWSHKAMSLPPWEQDDHAGSELEKRPRLVSCSTLTLAQESGKAEKSQQFPGITGNSQQFPWVGQQKNLKLLSNPYLVYTEVILDL